MNLVFHGRNKHINIKFCYIRELVKDKEIIFEFCYFKNQITNIFTSTIKVETLLKMKKIISIMIFEKFVLRERMLECMTFY